MNWDEIWQGSIMTSRKFGAVGNGGGQGLGDKESRRHPQSNHPFPEPRSQTSTKPHAFVRIIVEQTITARHYNDDDQDKISCDVREFITNTTCVHARDGASCELERSSHNVYRDQAKKKGPAIKGDKG